MELQLSLFDGWRKLWWKFRFRKRIFVTNSLENMFPQSSSIFAPLRVFFSRRLPSLARTTDNLPPKRLTNLRIRTVYLAARLLTVPAIRVESWLVPLDKPPQHFTNLRIRTVLPAARLLTAPAIRVEFWLPPLDKQEAVRLTKQFSLWTTPNFSRSLPALPTASVTLQPSLTNLQIRTDLPAARLLSVPAIRVGALELSLKKQSWHSATVGGRHVRFSTSGRRLECVCLL
jgi:hypothetical protein